MDLLKISKDIRIDLLRSIGSVGSGHIGGCLSIVEVLTLLYFKYMRIDPSTPKMEGRDRFVLSKGHAGPALYATLANRGYFEKDMLLILNKGGTKLPSHCDMNKTPGVDMTAGSLGQGFSCAVGIAKASKIVGDGARVYAIVGDGESQEGQIWEAAMWAAGQKLDNLIAFTDNNKMQIDGYTDEISPVSPLADKWRAFGWHVLEVADGNSLDEVDAAISEALTLQGKPVMIVLETVKGKGVAMAEAKGVGSHSFAMSPEEIEAAIEEIRRS